MEEGKEKRKPQEPKKTSNRKWSGTNKRSIGAIMEERAVGYLAEQGMQILERNYRCRQGEIDLIGWERGYLVFVEVKYRSGRRAGVPEAAVDWRKVRKICRTADYYRSMHEVWDCVPQRYDVVALEGEEIRWYRNAFSHTW